jgi:RNA recognition motif-containing protein
VSSVHLSIFLDAKLAIDVLTRETVQKSQVLVLTVDVAPSSPPKSLAHKAWVYNDGSGDVGDTASQFLLVRNLDTMLQEETIATGMAKLEVIPKRILLIRDRKTKVSWGFGFIEYQDVSVDPFYFIFNHSLLETHWINI